MRLSRRISPFALFVLGINAIVGSGWLFAPLYAAKIAGSGAIISWIIGGFAAMLIAVTFAELSVMLPVAGGTAQIPELSHGRFVSFILSWMAWLSSLILAPIEVQAVLQYASLYFPALMHSVNGAHVLTWLGGVWATALMLFLCCVNIFSFSGLTRFNYLIFICKLFVILTTIFTILHTHFNPGNFSDFIQTTQSTQGWQAIFTAVAAGGIAFAFNGFKSGVEMAGEAKKLSIAIPLSTVGSVAACLVLYLGLQICFIGALDPASLKDGWEHLNFTGDVGPFAGLAAGMGLLWLVKLLYIDALSSPTGAGLIYVTSTARILYAMSKIGYMPRFLSRVNKQHMPVYAILINFVIGMFSFLPLPGWQAMVNFLVSVLVITYAMGPIALMSLRLSLPNEKRPFRLPAANFFCLLAFYCCNLFGYWTGWETMSKLAIVLTVGLAIFACAYWRGKIKMERSELKSGLWMLPYLFGLIAISYLGSFGGQNQIPFGWDFLIIAVFSIIIFYLAVQSRAALTTEEVSEFLQAENSLLPQQT